MGLFGNKTRSRTGRVLRAAGMRLDSGNAQALRALSSAKQEWQSDAWGYRDLIGELRFAVQFLARAAARVQFLPAQVMPGEDEPIPLDSDKGVTIPAALRQAAEEELARLPLDSGYFFTGVLAENLEITGEAYLHGYEEDGEEVWEVLSVDEVIIGQDGRISIRRFGEPMAREVNEDSEEMLRLWVPHARYKNLADSPMRSLLGPCEDVVLAGREIRAASRSRFAANGVLLVPQGLTMLNNLREDSSLTEDTQFMADLAAVLLSPISNEGDPGAVVPAVLTGETEDLAGVRHFRMEREDSPTLLDKIDKALARIARGLDIPPEIITGMADANHWTAWQIDASTYRYHIDPLVRIIADSYTSGFLRPALRARGFSAADVKRVQVWYDAGNITENPNRAQDAKDAYERGVIGMDTLRQALGFNDSDAPSDEEMLRMMAFKIGVDTNTAAVLLRSLFGGSAADAIPVPSQRVEQPQLPPGQQPEEEPTTGPGQAPPSTPDSATPSPGAQTLLSMLLADASPQDEEPSDDEWIVDTESGRKLMELDRSTRDRLLHAADDALTRALEKAGARLRSKAQKDPQLRASLKDVDVMAVGRIVGREAALALGAEEQELLSGALDTLEAKFTRWVEAAIEQAVSTVLALLRLDPESDRGQRVAARLRDSMSGRSGTAWSMFRDALLRLAERYLFDPTPDASEGEEVPDVIVPPGLVRGVLSHIGGTPRDAGGVDEDGAPARGGVRPVGGIGLGEEVETVLAEEGAREIGFEWAYGITPVRHFEPHRALDGKRFSSWADPGLLTDAKNAWVGPIFQPGDHKGCMCDYVPAYAIPEYAEVIADRLGQETENARNDRLLAESDDRAGRTGTTAQAARDERQRIQKLQRRWIERGS